VFFILNLVEFYSVEVEFLIAPVQLTPHFFFTRHVRASIWTPGMLWWRPGWTFGWSGSSIFLDLGLLL